MSYKVKEGIVMAASAYIDTVVKGGCQVPPGFNNNIKQSQGVLFYELGENDYINPKATVDEILKTSSAVKVRFFESGKPVEVWCVWPQWLDELMDENKALVKEEE